MSYKTTILLAAALVIVAGAFYALNQYKNAQRETEEDTTQVVTPTEGVDRPLFEKPLGEVVKIVCEIPDHPKWVFEVRDEEAGPSAKWKMVEPSDAVVQDWMVRSIGSTLGRLKYTIRYDAGQAGAVTAADAGLDPPRAKISLTDEDGRSETVRVGRDASTSSAYVQLKEGGAIYLVDASLKNLLKERAMDYRDLKLVEFSPDKAVRLEITRHRDDGTTADYALVKRGTDWVFESPFEAKTADGKVRDALRSVSRLNAAAWVTDEAAPGAYGLDPPAVAAQVTVEETVTPEEEAEKPEEAEEGAEEEKPEPQVTTKTYEIRVSQISPIDDNAKVYIQARDDTAVATILKTSVDMLTTDIAEWRDMHVAAGDATRATRVEITTPDGQGVVEREGAAWQFEDGAPADAVEVRNLLNQVKELTAQSFLDESPEGVDFGLDAPQAELALTLPEKDGTERILVGGFTDERTKRLVYVQAGGGSVAKVRVDDVNLVLRAPSEYRDRQVFSFPVAEIEQIDMTRPNPITKEPETISLARDGEEWSMVQPVEADADVEAAKKLTGDLASLRAQEVVVPEGDLSSYGLDAPPVTVVLTRQPPEITKMVEVPADTQPAATTQPGTTTEPAATQPAMPTFRAETVQPPAEAFELALAQVEGKVYASQPETSVIYQMDPAFYGELLSEYHSKEIFDFEQSQVTAVSVKAPDGEDGFVKQDDEWQYVQEPDVPIDPKKVDNLIVQIADLKAESYVHYGATDEDLARYGLDEPVYTLTVQTGDTQKTLLVSKLICNEVPGRHTYALLEGTNDVFLVSANTVKRFAISLKDYEAE